MPAADLIKFDSNASKATLLLPLLALALTGVFVYVFVSPDSSLSKALLERMGQDYITILSAIVVFLDVILILLMFFFQPAKGEERTEPKKKEADARSVIISSGEEAPEPKEAAQQEKPGPKPEPKPEEKPAALEKPAVVARPEMPEPEMPVMEKMITYPQQVGGGIFADTYIPIGNGSTVKLRQEVVEEIYLIV